MIRVILRGDLGNQLFQYAVGRRLALRHGVPLVLNLWGRLGLRDPLGHRLRGKLAAFPLVCDFERLPARRRGQAYFGEERWGFHPEVLRLPGDALLYGYFQSARYFASIADKLRAELTSALPWPTAAARLADKARTHPSVAIHVRRGDYLRLPMHNVCGIDYYRRAIAHVRQHVSEAQLFVFSDDIPWCRANLPADSAKYIDPAQTGGDPTVDLRLMAACRHHIIANSTFSWWGAWMGAHHAQRVCVPSRWFNHPTMDMLAQRDTVLPTWQRIAA